MARVRRKSRYPPRPHLPHRFAGASTPFVRRGVFLCAVERFYGRVDANLPLSRTAATVLTPNRAAIQYRVVPPGGAAHFIFGNSRGTDERVWDVASFADLCTGRSRLRAGRGRLAHRRKRG